MKQQLNSNPAIKHDIHRSTYLRAIATLLHFMDHDCEHLVVDVDTVDRITGVPMHFEVEYELSVIYSLIRALFNRELEFEDCYVTFDTEKVDITPWYDMIDSCRLKDGVLMKKPTLEAI